ncbi:MAG TPA: EcsC family protein [Stellaceae bacterium]|jgi:uncharacterized protein (DUF697 family)
MASKLDAKTMAALLGALQWIYDKAVDGVPGLDSAADLAASYRRDGVSTDEAIDALIRGQTAKAAAAGFLTNIGGVVTLPVMLPANLISALYIQVRMVAAIAALRGHDLGSDRVRGFVLACLCGTSLMDVAKDVGVGISAGLVQQAIASLSVDALVRVERAGRFAVLRRAFDAVDVSRLAPLIGGLVAGVLDGALTRTYGSAAKRLFAPMATTELA